MKRKRRPALSEEQLTLLKYPPNEDTWFCRHERERAREDGTTYSSLTKVKNAGNARRCWLCGKPKPRRPELVWPLYQEALKHKEAVDTWTSS